MTKLTEFHKNKSPIKVQLLPFHLRLISIIIQRLNFAALHTRHRFIINLAKKLTGFLPKTNGEIIVSTRYGFRLAINPTEDHILSRSIYKQGTYEAGTLDVISKCLKPGDVFLDIGSNIGLMAIFAAKIVKKNGRVIAFEPEPSVFEKLQINIKLNRIQNIQPEQIALGSRQDIAPVFSKPANWGASSLIRPENGEARGKAVLVETLDSWLSNNKIRQVRMLKVDVEGMELEVFKGAQTLLNGYDAPIICYECSDMHPLIGGTQRDLYEFIKNINVYRVFRLQKGKDKISGLVEITASTELPAHDNLFCFLGQHIEQLPKALFAVKQT